MGSIARKLRNELWVLSFSMHISESFCMQAVFSCADSERYLREQEYRTNKRKEIEYLRKKIKKHTDIVKGMRQIKNARRKRL